MKLASLSLWLSCGMVAVTGQAEGLQVKWTGETGTTMNVLGLDSENRIRLSPTDGSAGEALVPLVEARDLQFVLPDEYREARRRASVGRPAEAVFLLRSSMPALVPYADIPGSNAGPAVRFYFNLLVDQRDWPEALATASGLIESMAEGAFVPDLVRLVRALQEEDLIADAAWLVGRLPLAGTDGFNRQLVVQVADEMRRLGHWGEAQSIYERLRLDTPPAEVARWDRLIAYTEWHQGSPLRAAAIVQTSEATPDPLGHEGLMGLLMGHVHFAQGDYAATLDVLGQTLVGGRTASEWRIEIMALIAEAYRADDQPALARLIEQDLQRMHPNSRWVKTPTKT